jgi:hypothetical protein
MDWLHTNGAIEAAMVIPNIDLTRIGIATPCTGGIMTKTGPSLANTHAQAHIGPNKVDGFQSIVFI